MKPNPNEQGALIPTLIIGSLFFIFGFVTWLNASLIPYLKIACELSDFQSLLVAFAFYIAYFFTALPMSAILRRLGLKNGMMAGLVIMALGAALFIPAALSRTYWIFLAGLFVTGTGLTLLQTAANPYVTIIGPLESAAKRISIMGICNKLAGVIAPLIMGAIILKDADGILAQTLHMEGAEKALLLDSLAKRVILPYSLMVLSLLVLAAGIRFSSLPEIEGEHQTAGGSLRGALSHPQLRLGIIALFLYVGAEVVAADTIGLFGQSQGIALEQAKNFASFTLAAMVIGYFAGIALIPKYISQSKALALSSLIGLLLTGMALLTEGYPAVLFIALLGLANALMWPAIWPLSLDGLGKHLPIASALLIMAIAGGALLPLLYGLSADIPEIGRQKAYALLIPCYFFILYYALWGHKKRKASVS